MADQIDVQDQPPEEITWNIEWESGAFIYADDSYVSGPVGLNGMCTISLVADLVDIVSDRLELVKGSVAGNSAQYHRPDNGVVTEPLRVGVGRILMSVEGITKLRNMLNETLGRIEKGTK